MSGAGMRIVVDGRQIADHFPGIGRYAFNLLLALASLDQPHTLLVLHNPAARNTRFDLRRLLASPRVRLVATGAAPFTFAEQLQVPALLRRLRADLYHAPYYLMPYAGLPCPAVVTLYDVIPRLFPGELRPRARLLFDLLTRLALRSARQAIAISASGREDISSAFGVARERFTVTPLAADERFRPQPPDALATLRAKLGLPPRYLLCVSSNKPHKNLVGLVEAFALLRSQREAQATRAPRVPLVIAGHFDPRYPEARERALALGLAEEIRFLPDVPEEELPALYAGAELFVFPSRYEGFGLPPLEAMACGAPVVCGRGSSLPEVVGDAALLVDVSHPAPLAEGIARALADERLRTRLRAAGLRRAACFSWRRTAELTLGAYERAAAS
jgi:glycosyltransferase involved in cell wall biosynthesis